MNVSRRGRWGATLVAAGLAAGLARRTPASGVAAAQAAGGVPACTNDDLAVSYRHTDDATGHRFGVIRITNVVRPPVPHGRVRRGARTSATATAPRSERPPTASRARCATWWCSPADGW